VKTLARFAISVSSLLVLAGCSSTQVTERQSNMGDERIARPDRILVYDFGSTPEDVPADSSIADQISEPSTPPTNEQLEMGRKLGAEVAKQLAAEISAMGLPGLRAIDQPSPRPGDLVIRGYFLSADEGSTAKRMLVGFGSGAADLKTFVEGYRMTDRACAHSDPGKSIPERKAELRACSCPWPSPSQPPTRSVSSSVER